MPAEDKNPAKTKETIRDRIADFVADTVTLDVLTLTGTVTLEPKAGTSAPADAKVKWDDLFKHLAAQMQAADSNKIAVVAYTHLEWDADSVNFVREGDGGDKALLDSHMAAVAAAQKARMDGLKTAAEIVQGFFR